jgi:multiple sugar transport system substrate-binding protein
VVRLSAVLLSVVVATLGCDRSPEAPADEARQPERTSVTLHVVVVNDPPLAAAIGRLRGEWAAASQNTLTVEDFTLEEVLREAPPKADVLVFPTRYLGTLCEKVLLRPIRDGVLDGRQYDAPDVFPLVRNRLLRYGGRTMALPLGVQVPLVCYRSDIFGQAGIRPELENKLPKALPFSRWGSILLLAQAAPLAVHPLDEATLFDSETMKPRITEPPFVRALTSLAADFSDGQAIDGSTFHVFSGQAGSAIGVPPAGQGWENLETDRVDRNLTSRIAWDELPGSDERFNPSTGEWETIARGHRRVPLLGTGGRLVGVTTPSRNAADGFRLTAWLASTEISAQLGSASFETMPCRASHVAGAAGWFGANVDRAASSRIAEPIQVALSRDTCLVVPRIPGVDEYLAALQTAVTEVVSNGETPETALRRAADTWEAITDRLGRQQQQTAYLRHLNLVE